MNGIVRGVCTQKGLTFAARQIRNSSPCMILIWPSNTVGYLLIIVPTSAILGVALTVLMSLVGVMEGAKIGVGWVYCEGNMLRLLAAFQDMMIPDACE